MDLVGDFYQRDQVGILFDQVGARIDLDRSPTIARQHIRMRLVDNECVRSSGANFAKKIFRSGNTARTEPDGGIVGYLTGYEYYTLAGRGGPCRCAATEVVLGQAQAGDFAAQRVCPGEFGLVEVCFVQNGREIARLTRIEIEAVSIDDLAVWRHMIRAKAGRMQKSIFDADDLSAGRQVVRAACTPECGVLTFSQKTGPASPPQCSAAGREVGRCKRTLPPLEAYAGHLLKIGESTANAVLQFDGIE
ncbi:hypothetical protein WK01_08890 [Burkholderia cepacia]|nr:hypothetical protein WK01_08890 [Burkholderia cepacia]